MKKKLFACFSMAAAGLWLAGLPAVAQSRGQGQGRPAGASASASHEPMGMSHGMSGSNGSTMARGPKTADELLTQNSQLSSKLAPLAGCMGTTSATCLQTAAQGFKNLGQFVAAVHVSNNLGIPFAQLKCTELGGQFCTPPTTAKGMSLGKAIQTLKPSMSSTEVNGATSKAMHQAHGDISKS
jgi:hypothetical protein